MLNINARDERAGIGNGPVKVASPLQREINNLKQSLDEQEKIISELRERLKPVFTDSPASPANKDEPLPAMSEMPSRVQDCRKQVGSNNAVLLYLLERIEV